MKKILLVLAFISFGITAIAQKVEKFTINNVTYYGTKAIPDNILGEYKYEKTKEPIAFIDKGANGKFQVHDVPAYPAEFWIETDAKGTIQKKTGATKNYQMVLILKYGDNGQSGWKGEKKGSYDRIEVTVALDQGYAIIMGERFKSLKLN